LAATIKVNFRSTAGVYRVFFFLPSFHKQWSRRAVICISNLERWGVWGTQEGKRERWAFCRTACNMRQPQNAAPLDRWGVEKMLEIYVGCPESAAAKSGARLKRWGKQ